MKPIEMFNQLENTGNHYSYFKRGRKYVYFSTGGWSDNEELVSELKKELCWSLLLVKWEAGGHYTFKIPSKEMMFTDLKRSRSKFKGEKKMKQEYLLIDITKLNNSWRLRDEIKDSNCKIVSEFSNEFD